MRIRLGLAFALVGVLALAFGAGGAAAHKKTYGSSVKTDEAILGFTPTAVEVFGRVKSKEDRCKNRRSVQVFERNGSTTRLGKTRTNKRGEWRFEGDLQAPFVAGSDVEVFAKIKKLKFGHNKRHKCSGDKSKAVIPRPQD